MIKMNKQNTETPWHHPRFMKLEHNKVELNILFMQCSIQLSLGTIGSYSQMPLTPWHGIKGPLQSDLNVPISS